MELKIKIHRALRDVNDEEMFVIEFKTPIKLSTAIQKCLRNSPKLLAQIFKEDKPRHGILFFSENAELSTLGLLDKAIDVLENMEIKIVPIMHGGKI